MCGIVGAVGLADVSDLVQTASQVQIHRGPDAQGVYFKRFGDVSLGLGHQRLSILDLSSAGSQPMKSRSGRFIIAFNGEVYNYVELAQQYGLQGLRSSSDTEVVVELIELLGPQRAFSEFNGMWSILVVDSLERKLYLSRDRFGKKPLYFYMREDLVFFASELKSFLSVPGLTLKPNCRVAARYLSQSLQDIDEETWLDGVSAFPAGCFGVLNLDQIKLGIQDKANYWTPDSYELPTSLSFDAYIAELRNTMIDAVRLRLRSDVPVGVALSGGIDSSIIASITHRLLGDASSGICFLSAVNPGAPNDESPFIDIMGKYLDVPISKVELRVEQGGDLLPLLQRCSYVNDAPLASFSNILFYMLMESAFGLDTKVIFSGQGADEAFCGYKKYPMFEIKRLLKSGRIVEAVMFGMGFGLRGTIFSQFSIAEAKRYLGSKNESLLGSACREVAVAEALGAISGGVADRQWQDVSKYSVPYLTHYEDRMSMSWSREVRLPFLDYRVMQLGLKAPTRFKMQSGWTKYCLRRAFEDYLPPEVAWRKDKQGFVNPQDNWLRMGLRQAVDDMILDAKSPVFSFGLVDQLAYRKLFNRYCAGDKRIWFRDVFSPFALNVWLQGFGLCS